MKTLRNLLIGLAILAGMVTTAAQAQTWLTNGLVGYWPFDGSANDASGHGLNGTVYSATLVADRFGKTASAYSFSGSSSCYISVPSTAALQLTTNLSISFWMKRSPVSPYGLIVCKGDAEQAYSVGFDTVGHNGGIGFARQNVVNMVYSTTATPTNQWIQIVCTLNGTNACIYYNGQFNTNGTGVTLGKGTGALTFGTIRSGTPVSYSGLLDDIRIYNRALSSVEVAHLYYAESGFLNIQKAVYVDSGILSVGTSYQLQVSSDLLNWTNQGEAFTATNLYWRCPNYYDVENWNALFFRLKPQ